MLKYAIIYTTRSENCVKFYGKVLTKFNSCGVLHSKQASRGNPAFLSYQKSNIGCYAHDCCIIITDTGFLCFRSCMTNLEKNKQAKKPLPFELSLFFEEDSVIIIERDAGELFNITDPNMQIKGLSSFILSGLMVTHDEKSLSCDDRL